MYLFIKRDFNRPEMHTLTDSKTLPCDSQISQAMLPAASRFCNITVLRRQLQPCLSWATAQMIPAFGELAKASSILGLRVYFTFAFERKMQLWALKLTV